MKKVIDQLKAFIKEYPPLFWVVILLLCGFSLYINYALGLKNWLVAASGWHDFTCWGLVYGVHLFAGYGLYSLFLRDVSFWKRPGFWVVSFFALGTFAFREAFKQHHDWVALWSSPETVAINQTSFKYLFRMSYLLIPLLGYWYVRDRQEQPFYGFSTKHQSLRLYFYLLLCMVPLIVFAATQTDFLDFYPRAKRLGSEDLPAWRYMVFEACYGLDFISIELFFRGFMIMAFARYVGIHAILPMALFYVSIHFGKPMGEALSSFFGGTILGVIAFHGRSIYGGIMVHMGIAWLMELAGFIGNQYR